MGGTILLADDSITIQKVVELTFAETEHRVVAVSGGNELLRRLGDVNPDVVVCDVIMPDLNGYEVCQTLKSDPSTLHIPVVLLTGTFEPFDRDRAMAVGSDAIITKPFEARELIDVVEDLIRRSQATRGAQGEADGDAGLVDMGIPEGVPALEFTTTGFDAMVPPPVIEPTMPEQGIELTDSALGRPVTPIRTQVEEPAIESEVIPFPDAVPPAEAFEPGEAREAEPAVAAQNNLEEQRSPEVAEGPTVAPFDEPVSPALPEAFGGEEGAGFAIGDGAGELPEPAPQVEELGAVGESPASFTGAAEEPWSPEAPGFVADGQDVQGADVGGDLVDAESQFAPEEEPLGPPPERFRAAESEGEQAEPEVAQAEPELAAQVPPVVEETEGHPAEQAVEDVVVPEVGEAGLVSPPPGAPPEEDLWPEEEAVVPEPVAVPGIEPLLAGDDAGSLEGGSWVSPEQPLSVTDEAGAAAEEPVAVVEETPQPAEETWPQPPLEEAAGGFVEPSSVFAEAALEEPARQLAEVPGEAFGLEPTEQNETPEQAPVQPEVMVSTEPSTIVEPATQSEAPAPDEVTEEIATDSRPAGMEAPPAAVVVGEELVEQIVGRVLGRLPAQEPARGAFVEVPEHEVNRIVRRVAEQLGSAPALPAGMSYELENGEIEKIARRAVELMPAPVVPEPVTVPLVELGDAETERIVAAVLARVPAPPEPVLPPTVLPESEVERVATLVLSRMPAPVAAPAVQLSADELERVASRVLELVPTQQPAIQPVVSLVGHEPESAEVDRIARRALELAGPMLEKIAWEVLPDLAEMLVRRRIAEIEAAAESES